MIGYVPESQYAQAASQMFGAGSSGPSYAPTINPYGIGGVGVGGVGGARPWG